MNLVTGAAGHLGNVLVRELLSKGENVKALVLPGEDLRSLEGLDIECIEGNILCKDDLRRAFEGIDTVFHMAALVAITTDQEDLLKRVNIDGTQNVIEVVKEMGVNRMIYTSSIHALERVPDGVGIDETLKFDANNMAGAYDRTKAAASLLVLDAVRSGLDAVIVCPTGVIGPYDFRRSELGEVIIDWMKSKPSISMQGHFDFVDVRDVAQGHILAKDSGKTGELYLISGEQTEISTLRSLVQSAMGIKTHEIKFTAPIAYLVAPIAELYYRITKTRPKFTRYSIETLQSNSQISSTKAKQQLGYQPRNVAVTIKDTVQWWLQNHSLTKSSLRSQK